MAGCGFAAWTCGRREKLAHQQHAVVRPSERRGTLRSHRAVPAQATSPPTLTFNGNADVVAPPSMARALHSRLDAHGVTNLLHLVPRRGHLLDFGEYSVGGQMVWFHFERFLAAVMPVVA